MVKLTPLVRTFLVAVATTGNILVGSYSDRMPFWATAIVLGAITSIAGLGIIPPHVGTSTVITRDIVAAEPPDRLH